ncbi:hypothetical protein [uncultured Alloprevotella sp.]|uniref:hypothetical protein n=1 Tax=uncultured Alloprevotella sp. TaxID=1283315 RepID=UPI00262D886F|nr:hypothetical protein [uncultured Alloprevotella sp.]
MMVRIRYVVQIPCIMNLFDRILKRFDKSARGLLGTNNRLLPANHRFFPPNDGLARANHNNIIAVR